MIIHFVEICFRNNQYYSISLFQLGNALGFVRSMKAAADLVVSDALVYDREEETTER